MPSFHVEQIDSREDILAWDHYVLDHPHATGCHLTSWRRVIHEAFGHQCYYLAVRDAAGTIRGVLPLVFLASRLFGRCLVSMPFLNYGGVLADDTEASSRLISAAIDLGRRLDASYLELRQQEQLECGLGSQRRKVAMMLELPSNAEQLWRLFPSKLRNQIRRAEKEGMSVRFGRDEILDDFYEVFARNMRDLGTPVYAKRFFQAVLNAFPKEARLCVIYGHGRALAGGMLCAFRQSMEIPWASSDRRYNHLAPNMLLYHSALAYACRESCRAFDFGRSTIDSGTYRFKEQWGARPVPLHWYYWVPDGTEPPALNPQNPKYRSAILLWQRLPLSVANFVGPRIVRYIP